MPTRKILISAVALLAAASSGCIKMEHSLHLREDGSGRYAVTYTTPGQTITRLKAMRELRRDLARAAGRSAEKAAAKGLAETFLQGTEAEIRDFVERFQPHGVEIKAISVDIRDAQRVFKLETTFDDIGKLAQTPFFEAYGFSLTKNRDGDYVLYRAAPIDRNAPTLDLSNPEDAKLVAPFLQGFQTKVRVTVPGRILKSNAPATSLHTSIWSFDFDQNPESYADLLSKGLGLVFDGTGSTLPQIRREAEKRR